MLMCNVELFWSFKAQVDVGRQEVPASTSTLKTENVKTLLQYLVLLREITFVGMTQFVVINPYRTNVENRVSS
jgi:hypothetical protein